MRYTLLALALILSVYGAEALTVEIRDAYTNESINSTINYNFSSYYSLQENALSDNETVILSATSTLQAYSPGAYTNGSYYAFANSSFTNNGTQFALYANYSKPLLYTNSTVHMIKHGSLNIYNATIPVSCLNNGNYLQVVIMGLVNATSPSTYTTQPYCYNGTAWVTYGNTSTLQSGVVSTCGSEPETDMYDNNYFDSARVSYLTGVGWTCLNVPSSFRIGEEGVWWNRPNITASEVGIESENIYATQYNTTIVSVNASGFISNSTTFSYYEGETKYVYLTPNNTINMLFVDEQTGNVINSTTIFAYFNNNVFAYNKSTTNGSITQTNLSAGQYNFTIVASGYAQRQYTYNINIWSNDTIVFYLLNSNNATAVRFTVLNQAYQPLRQATVNALKRNLSGLNYYNVADCTTDNNGECIIYLELLSPTYRFLTEYGSITRISSDTVLSRDTYTIVLTTTTSSLQNVLGSNNIQSSLVSSGSIGSTVFTYTTNNPSNEPVTSTLVVYRRYGNRLIELERSTSSSVSNIIVSSAVNASLGDEIIAEGYVEVEGSNLLTHQTTVVDNAQGASLGASMLILVLCVVFTVIFMFAWNPIAPMLMFGVLLLFFNAVNMISIGVPAVISIIVIIFIAVYRMRSV